MFALDAPVLVNAILGVIVPLLSGLTVAALITCALIARLLIDAIST